MDYIVILSSKAVGDLEAIVRYMALSNPEADQIAVTLPGAEPRRKNLGRRAWWFAWESLPWFRDCQDWGHPLSIPPQRSFSVPFPASDGAIVLPYLG
jgi:hypothetical protein